MTVENLSTDCKDCNVPAIFTRIGQLFRLNRRVSPPLQPVFHLTPKRLAELEEDDAVITPEEAAAGWHFCEEYDFLLTRPGVEPCQCKVPGRMK